MLFDQPHLYEIEDMMAFCKKFSKIYIYGCAVNQEYLCKFLMTCGVNVAGFITTREDTRELSFAKIKKYTIDTVDLADAGIIIGLSDRYYDNVIPRLRAMQCSDFFCVCEHNKRSIAYKQTARPRERMWIEINIADHCNLNCQCCDHFSHLAPPTFLDIDVFKKDMERLAFLSGNNIASIKLQGGEPLLHKDINKFIEITRAFFPDNHIALFTNGLLLKKAETNPAGNFWQCCAENNVEILMTRYPINLDTEPIEELAKKYNASLQIFGEAATRKTGGESMGLYTLPPQAISKRSTKHPFDLDGKVGKHEFVSCYHFNETITLRHGRLYPCSVIPYSGYFNDAFGKDLVISDEDSIDIHKAGSYEEIAEFVANRVPFCSYCDIKHRHSLPWARSTKEIEEYI